MTITVDRNEGNARIPVKIENLAVLQEFLVAQLWPTAAPLDPKTREAISSLLAMITTAKGMARV